MELEKYSMGIGDRFGFQCAAQLRALQKAAGSGIRIVPVWNKSNREHVIARTVPEDASKAAIEAEPMCRNYNPHLRQLMHLGFKIAAEVGAKMAELRRECRVAIEENVTTNIYARHIRPLFLGLESNE